MTEHAPAVDWIAVDWGTSNLRAAAMAGDRVVETRQSDRGMGALGPGDFAPALEAICHGWPTAAPVLAAGMVGARQGWVEAPYLPAPCAPPGLAQAARAPGPREVWVLPGVCQARPADVMRGEETQIAGWLARAPDFDGVLCLPGTHSKWVRISAGEIISFQTFMTGELFQTLTRHSVLRHTVTGDGWDDAAFAVALGDALSRPAAVAAALFGLRAQALLDGLDPGTARARLSGLLIGLELGAARPYWLGQAVGLIGSDRVTGVYGAALGAQGVPVESADGQAMTRAGLVAAKGGT